MIQQRESKNARLDTNMDVTCTYLCKNFPIITTTIRQIRHTIGIMRNECDIKESYEQNMRDIHAEAIRRLLQIVEEIMNDGDDKIWTEELNH